jgi:UDP-N-acetylglucosamine 2-epimerase (non-hydrolysing)
MAKPRIACVVGTRPDAIKMAPLVRELKGFSEEAETVLISTGQHREMLDQALEAFELSADRDLSVMRHGQTLAGVTTRALEGLDEAFTEIAPDYVLAQGDTTSTFCASLAAFYRRIPFGHEPTRSTTLSPRSSTEGQPGSCRPITSHRRGGPPKT